MKNSKSKKVIRLIILALLLSVIGLFTVLAQQYPSINVLQHSLGGSGDDRIIKVLATSDDYYLLAGWTKSADGDVRSAHGFSDFWAVKIDGFTGDTIWTSRAMGGSQFDEVTNAFVSPDGHYILSGTTSSANGDVRNGYGNGLSDIWVIKLNPITGDTIWTSRALGGSGNDEVKVAFVSNDGKYVIAGGSSSANGDVTAQHGGIADFWILTLDPLTGNLLKKSRALGGSGWEQLSKAFNAPDGHYILAGSTTSANSDVHGSHGNNDFWVVKIDSNSMDTIWTKTLGGSADDFVTNAFAAPDGNYVIMGYSKSSDGDVHGGHGNADLWVVKLNANNGDTIWTSRALGGSLDDGLGVDAAGAILDNDGNYIFITQAASLNGDVSGGHGSTDIWIVKLDANTGDTIYTSKAMGGNIGEEFSQIKPTCDGGWLISMDTYTQIANGDITQSSPVNNAESLWIVKTDSLFNIEWDKVMADSTSGGLHADYNSTFFTTDGGFVMTGWSSQTVIAGTKTVTGHGSFDFWIAKMKWIEADFSVMDTVCVGESVPFTDSTQGLSTALPGVNWQWYFGDGTGSTLQNPQHTYNIPGTYMVTQIVNKECQWDTIVRSITVVGSVLELGNDSNFCYPDTSFIIDAGSNGVNYSWSTGDTTQSILVNNTGEYSVQVTDTLGCLPTDTINIAFYPLPIITTSDDTTICVGASVELTATGGITYLWTPASWLNDSTANPAVARPINAITYYVTTTDTNGCTNMDTTGIVISIQDCDIYLSNSFSPDGDGLNDTWMIQSNELESLEVQIYSRLGEKVFETTNMNIVWDGTDKEGNDLKSGIYTYSFEGITLTGEKIKKKGNITLIK